jgi:uncharacterized membrane protein HdeD (DUF308 family)
MNVIQSNKTLFVLEGIGLIILGCLAIALPVVFTFGITMIVGCILFVGGCIQTVQAFQSEGVPGFLFALITAVVSLIIGLVLIFNPIAGAKTLTLLLALFFIISGIAKIVWGTKLRHYKGWIGVIISGIIALIMAAIIISGWPETALWVIGLLIGIDLLFFGLSLIALVFSGPSRSES